MALLGNEVFGDEISYDEVILFFFGGGNTTMTDVLRRRGEDTQRQRGDTGKEVV